jgi:putative spermidine/putrescine transport system permease protein
LFALLIQSFFYLTIYWRMVRQFTLSTYADLFTPLILIRRTWEAVAVTLGRHSGLSPGLYGALRPPAKVILYLAVLLPLWSSYLVRVHSGS